MNEERRADDPAKCMKQCQEMSVVKIDYWVRYWNKDLKAVKSNRHGYSRMRGKEFKTTHLGERFKAFGEICRVVGVGNASDGC